MKRLATLLAAAAIAVAASAQINEVKRIPKTGNDHNTVSSVYENNTGFWCAAEASAGYSLHSHNNAGFSEADITLGWRFNEYLRVGPGFGFRYYFPKHHLRVRNTRKAMPIYFNFRGNLLNSTYRSVTPYYSLDIGGTIQDGFMWRPTIGVRIGQPRKAFTIGLSYVGQNILDYKCHENRDGDVRLDKGSRYVSFISLRLGYEF